MLRLNKNRRKSTKGKQSSKEQSVEKTNSRPYEENYNEVILNDLVPEEKRNELGLQSEAPKDSKKKSSGLNLNFGLGSKKSKKSKESVTTEKTKESSKNKSGNKQQSNNNEKVESKPSKGHKDSQATTDKTKSSKKNNKASDESKQSKTSKGNEKNSNSKSGKQKTKSSKGSKATKSDVVEHIEEQNVSKEEVKKTQRPVVNPKKRRRQEQTDNSRSSDEEVELEIEEISEDDSDSLGFRNLDEENKVEEIEPVKSKFEDLVWSEDKFPKK